MIDVRLLDTAGHTVVILTVPDGGRPPQVIVWGDRVYLDRVRDHKNYVEVEALFVAYQVAYQSGERVAVPEGEGKVAGAFTHGSGV